MTTKQIKQTKQGRTISEEFKKEKVKLISESKASDIEISKLENRPVIEIYDFPKQSQ
jgi:hypothetical protein